MRFLILLFLCLIHTFGNETITKVYDKDIFIKYENWNKYKLEKKRTITFNNNLFANNCLEYIKLKRNNVLKESERNLKIYKDYIDCDFINSINSQRKIVFKNSSNINHSKVLWKEFNLNSIHSSLSPRLNNNEYTLFNVLGKYSFKTNTTLFFNDDDWIYNFKLIFLKENAKKFKYFFLFEDKSSKSSYVDYQIITFSRNKLIFF